MDQNTQIPLTLSLGQIQSIVAVLAEQPFKNVVSTIGGIEAQVQAFAAKETEAMQKRMHDEELERDKAKTKTK